jgi:hypothetical protein
LSTPRITDDLEDYKMSDEGKTEPEVFVRLSEAVEVAGNAVLAFSVDAKENIESFPVPERKGVAGLWVEAFELLMASWDGVLKDNLYEIVIKIPEVKEIVEHRIFQYKSNKSIVDDSIWTDEMKGTC